MKKLFFLLVVFLMGFGLVFAGTNPAEPPGVFTAEVAKPMAEYVAQEGIVTQPIVLTVSVTAEPTSIQAVMVYDDFTTIKPFNSGGIFLYISMNVRQYWTDTDGHYHLRC